MNPLEMVKKHARLRNRLFMMSELGVRPNFDVRPRLVGNRHEKSDFNEFNFRAHEPLRNGKKKYQALESLNSDF